MPLKSVIFVSRELRDSLSGIEGLSQFETVTESWILVPLHQVKTKILREGIAYVSAAWNELQCADGYLLLVFGV